jgi:hypothetical protein
MHSESDGQPLTATYRSSAPGKALVRRRIRITFMPTVPDCLFPGQVGRKMFTSHGTAEQSAQTSRDPDLGRKFVDLVTGEAGQQVLNQAGFAKPRTH